MRTKLCLTDVRPSCGAQPESTSPSEGFELAEDAVPPSRGAGAAAAPAAGARLNGAAGPPARPHRSPPAVAVPRALTY